FADRQFELLFGHRSLVQRARHRQAQLVDVERLAPAVALDDGRQPELGGFQRGKTLAAPGALATTTDRCAVLADARIDHAGVFVLAERTEHFPRISRTPGISCTAPSPPRALSRARP